MGYQHRFAKFPDEIRGERHAEHTGLDFHMIRSYLWSGACIGYTSSSFSFFWTAFFFFSSRPTALTSLLQKEVAIKKNFHCFSFALPFYSCLSSLWLAPSVPSASAFPPAPPPLPSNAPLSSKTLANNRTIAC